MKITKIWNPVVLAGALSLLTACGNNDKQTMENDSKPAEPVQDAQAEAPIPETADDKISYLIGYQMAGRYASDPVLELDKALLIQGIEDAIAGKESMIGEQDAQVASEELQKRFESHQAVASEQGQAAGKAFLESNKAKPGIVATASGLQYEVIKKGDSDQSPKATDTVKVHYHGTLVDGTVFDSSVDRGEPISFALNGVIRGWTEGLQLMSVGDTYRFYIPSDLGYGPRATGSIPPNSVLIFDVELLGINEK